MNRSRRLSPSSAVRAPAFTLALWAAAVGLTAPAAAQVVINEIDYDQPSTDTAEFIELKNVGAAAESLDGYSLELVNGSGGGAVVYQTVDLPSVDLAAGGYFVVCADAGTTPSCDLDVSPGSNLVQNGSPDAVALLFGAAIVDTVSYEGDTAAPYTEGSGSGLEDPSSADFVGIARFPDGADTDVNNVDLSPRCITPGEENAAAESGCGAPGPVQLVINEIDYDQPGTDTGEFVEILNTGATAASLTGVEVVLVNGSSGGASVYQTIPLPDVSLPGGGYFVVCADAAQVDPCDLDVEPDTNLIQNGAPDAVALVQDGEILDTVSYEGDTGAPYTEGSGSGLEDDSGVDLVGLSRLPDGVDTGQNNVDLSLRCATPGLPNSSDNSDCTVAGPPELVVNEVDYDQPGTDAGEFVEIFNAGTAAVDLAGVEVRLVNGSGGGAVVYQAIALPAGELAAGDFFVVCADASKTPNCDLDVSPDTNLVQNGAPDAVAVAFGGVILDTVSYEGDTGAPYTEGSGVGLEDNNVDALLGLSRLPDGADTDVNNADLSLRCITPGEANSADTTGCAIGPPQELEIWQIQGPGLASPVENTVAVTSDNVVTAVGPDGFFIQTPEARTDGDPETSDGIFVFTGSAPAVAVGDVVDVTGTVQEFFELTELAGGVEVTVTGSGAPLPPVVMLDAETPSPDQPQPENELERYEGMRVIFDGVATAPSDDFGDVAVVAKPERAFREPGIEFPGLEGLPVWDGNPEIFEVDPDAMGLEDADLFAGQPVAAEGPLSFAFGDYQVWPTSFAPGTEPVLPRPVRERAAGELTVATQNIERFFDDQDDPETDDPVLTPEQYQARLGKVSRWVREVLRAPDVLVVQEVENVGILEDLADRLALDDPALAYSPWLLEGNDIGGIDVGMLTRDDSISVQSVEQFGADIVFDYDGSLLNDRPPLVLRATYVGDGESFEFTLIGVHQRSLGGIEGSEAERVRLKRFRQAEVLSQFIQDLQTAESDRPLLVAGDFNAFEFTDGYVDVLGQVTGNLDPLGDEAETYDAVDPDLRNEVVQLPVEERYSFLFGGSAQVLDHVLTSEAAQARIVDRAYARGNADAPEALLNDSESSLRISDHDGFVVFLQASLGAADADGDAVPDEEDLCPATTIPEAVPEILLLPFHYALEDDDTTFDTFEPGAAGSAREARAALELAAYASELDPFGGRPGRPGDFGLAFTTADTGGCSCEQILDALELGPVQRWFGCGLGTMLYWTEQVVP